MCKGEGKGPARAGSLKIQFLSDPAYFGVVGVQWWNFVVEKVFVCSRTD